MTSNEFQELSTRLAEFASTVRRMNPPPELEEKLLAAFRTQRPTPPPGVTWWRVAAGVAAVMAIAVVLWREPPELTESQRSKTQGKMAAFRPAAPQSATVDTVPTPVGPVPAVRAKSTRPLPTPGRAPRTPSAPPREIVTEFLPLRGGEVFASDEWVQVIRVGLARAEMSRFGFPVPDEARGEIVRADVMLGSDGTARAVRFVH
jgi:hypothetical protein